ncbi:hypothetical protein BGZ51_002575 [Haplosporangium sp. Z 767]|nr:hypothetical protein BGZ51_002575 [Haplosporangium sp. Z 767]
MNKSQQRFPNSPRMNPMPDQDTAQAADVQANNSNPNAHSNAHPDTGAELQAPDLLGTHSTPVNPPNDEQ